MKSSYAIVNAKQCQELRLELRSRDLLNTGLPCMKFHDKIGIPVKENLSKEASVVCLEDDSFVLNAVPFQLKEKTVDKPVPKTRDLKEVVRSVMIGRGLWQADLETEVPTSWEKYEDLILFGHDKHFKSAAWGEAGPELWTDVCATLNGKRIALKSCISADGFRTPKVKLVWGASSWVNSMDNGIRYSWDVTKNMFCAGNAPERHRVAKLKCNGEVVLDLYAGIGYFTLPYLVHAGAKLVHACEWNPDAVDALRKNLLLNNVTARCIVHEGDNREVQLLNVADRVNLGLLPSCEVGWKVACRALKSTGGVLHVHGNVTSGLDKHVQCSFCQELLKSATLKDFIDKDYNQSFCLVGNDFVSSNVLVLWKRVEWKTWTLHVSHCICKILEEEHRFRWKVSVLHLHCVKSYAPRIHHLVLDLHCQPATRTNTDFHFTGVA